MVSLIGTRWVMRILGISINMFSMLALVLALGIVVDDAIVVGENILRNERGAATGSRRRSGARAGSAVPSSSRC